jgi:hypothetical protein
MLRNRPALALRTRWQGRIWRAGPTTRTLVTARTHKEPTGEHQELTHVRQRRTTLVNLAYGASLDGNDESFRTASLLGGTRQRRRRFCAPSVGVDQGRRHCSWRSPDDRNWRWIADWYRSFSAFTCAGPGEIHRTGLKDRPGHERWRCSRRRGDRPPGSRREGLQWCAARPSPRYRRWRRSR